MKAIEHYLRVVLFIMLHKVVITFKSVVEILKCAISFKLLSSTSVVPFIMLYMVVVRFEPVDKILLFEHSCGINGWS